MSNLNPRFLLTKDSDSVQSSPDAVVAVIAYDKKNLWDFRTQSAKPAPDFNQSYTVYQFPSQLRQVRTMRSKASHVKAMSATFIDPDKEVLEKIGAGDWVVVWMFDNKEDAARVSSKVSNYVAKGRSLPLADSIGKGLKMIARVQSVREQVNKDPHTGRVFNFTTINGASFSEFNTSVYYNPRIVQSNDPDNNWAMNTVAGYRDLWKLISTNPLIARMDRIVPFMIDVFLGRGPSKENPIIARNNPNQAFLVPKAIADILGIPEPNGRRLTYADIITTLVGIQNYQGSNYPTLDYNYIKEMGMGDNRLWTTHKILSVFNPIVTPWDGTPVWSIIQGFLNPAVNEMYTCLRPDKDGWIKPHLIVRQKPFNTDAYVHSALSNKLPATAFTNLPRWVIDPQKVISSNIGKSDTERINYVEVQLLTGGAGTGQWQADANMANGFFKANPPDIERHGLRPYISSVHSYYADLVDQERLNVFDADLKPDPKNASVGSSQAHNWLGNNISSGYSASRQHPTLAIFRPHRGVDIPLPERTPVGAAEAGTVVATAFDQGWGNYVVIHHGPTGPAGEETYTLYAHLFQTNVRKGQSVDSGFVIGLAGQTGTATGPHLHFEVRRARNTFRQDPSDLWVDGLGGFTVDPLTSEFRYYTPGRGVWGPASSVFGSEEAANEQAKKVAIHGEMWPTLMADQLFYSHLKYNGTIVSHGIQEPIAEGDNIEYDGKVLHIEQIEDSVQMISEHGTKTFTTTLHVSSGVPADPADFPDIFSQSIGAETEV